MNPGFREERCTRATVDNHYFKSYRWHMNTCMFCKIVNSEEASVIVLDDEQFIAFLDTRPLFPGHCLLIPKAHVNTLYDLPPELVQPLFTHVQKLGRAVEKAMAAEGSFVAMNNKVSQSVPHLHVHIVPRNPKDGLKGFFWPRSRYTDQEHMHAVQQRIKQALAEI